MPPGPSLLVLILAALRPTSASELQNVTSSVFAKVSSLSFWPAAFADFNSDKLTDLIVVDANKPSVVAVLLAQATTFSIADEKYFNSMEEAKRSHLSCDLEGMTVVGAQPADFDGDGAMDLAVVAKAATAGSAEVERTVYLLWGDHRQESGQWQVTDDLSVSSAVPAHSLVCPAAAESRGQAVSLVIEGEPSILDANGDNVADLLAQVNGTLGVWLFGAGRRAKPDFLPLGQEHGQLKTPHSNAFVDANGDGQADLIISTKEGLEFWENVGSRDKKHFKRWTRIPWPGKHVGQAAFADFDLDGKLDVLIPTCESEDCKEGNKMFFASLVKLWYGHMNLEEMNLFIGGWR